MSTATTEDSNIMKLSLTELLTKRYTSTLTFLFDNESPPSSVTMQVQETKERVSNDIKNLNCTKLSLLIVKALLSSTTINDTTGNTIEGGATNEVANNQQLSTNDFLIKIKLNDNNLILLDASYNPAISEGSAANIQGIQITASIQKSIGHLLHTIFTSDTNKQTQIIQQKSSVVSEESDIVENSSNSKGGKDLRIAKVRRSQTNTLFATLGKFKQSLCVMCA